MGDVSPRSARSMRWLAVVGTLGLFFAMGLYLVVAAHSLLQVSAGAGMHRPDTIITIHLPPTMTPALAPPVSTARSSPQAEAPASRLPTTPAAAVQAKPALPKAIPAVGRDGHLQALHAAANTTARRPAVAVGGMSSAFQMELLAHIEQYRDYPAAAVQEHLQGVVQVLFRMDRNGRITGVWVKAGSGYDVLDQAAVNTVWRSQPLPPIPPGLPEQLTVLLPVAFAPP